MTLVRVALITLATAMALRADMTIERLSGVVEKNFYIAKVVDVDADGHLDIIASVQGGTGGIEIRWGQAGGFEEDVQVFKQLVFSRTMVIEDFTGDNLPDLAVGNADDPGVFLFRNLGKRSFSIETIDDARGTHSLAAADVDRDNKLDLVSADRLESRDLVWYRNGAAGWEPEVISTQLVLPAAVVAGNLDDDDAVELVVATRSGHYLVDDPQPGEAATGSFGTPRLIADLNRADGRQQVLGDFDQDGDLDIAVTMQDVADENFRSGRDTKVVLLRNEGDLSFTYQELAADCNSQGLESPRFYYRWIDSTDLDGDGDLDLIVSRWEGVGTRFLVLFNDGAGCFQSTGIHFSRTRVEAEDMYSFAVWPQPDGRGGILPGINLRNSLGTQEWPLFKFSPDGFFDDARLEVSRSEEETVQLIVKDGRPAPTLYLVKFSEDMIRWSGKYEFIPRGYRTLSIPGTSTRPRHISAHPAQLYMRLTTVQDLELDDPR